MVKTADELALMRTSGRLLAQVFEMLDTLELAGMSTLAINDLVERYITHDLSRAPRARGNMALPMCSTARSTKSSVTAYRAPRTW